MELSFPTRKLGASIAKIKTRYRDIEPNNSIKVYGVTNREGIVITGKDVSADTSNYIVVKENTFVYNPYRVNIGSIGVSKVNFFGIVSPAYVVFKTKEDINSEFLLLYLKSSLGLNLIKWYGDKGGVRSALGFNDLQKIDFPDLTYEQQEKALKKIKLFTDSSNKINDKLDNILNSYITLKQSILQDAIQGKLVPKDQNDEPAEKLLEKIKVENDIPLSSISENEIPYELPKNWVWCRLENITKLMSGIQPEVDINENIVPYIKVSDMNLPENKKGVVSTSSGYINPTKYKRNIIPSGSIIFPKRGGAIATNKKLLTKTDIVADSNTMAIVPYIKETLMYIFYWFKTINLALLNTGTAVPQINNKDVGPLIVSLPPLNEQKRIVEKVESLMRICDEQEENINKAKENLNKLNQAILREMFN